MRRKVAWLLLLTALLALCAASGASGRNAAAQGQLLSLRVTVKSNIFLVAVTYNGSGVSPKVYVSFNAGDLVTQKDYLPRVQLPRGARIVRKDGINTMIIGPGLGHGKSMVVRAVFQPGARVCIVDRRAFLVGNGSTLIQYVQPVCNFNL